ncbi:MULTISPECIES: hypothetical protein [unclassified Mesorhizobium]|uniref:hypothetical protein n=1 Tax=unclassified Mesorhizobium TaxID=325217 RepID=UPI0012EC99A8|nr:MULTISPECIES: hypothetical protein [unclassified Mesorhizobium]
MTELSDVFKRRFNARLLADFTDDVVAAYQNAPLGPHDDKTARVVRALGGAAIADKEIVISLGANGPWAIGRIALGKAGNFVRLADTFTSYQDALRSVFSIRHQAFLATFRSPGELRLNEGAGNKP